MFYIHRTSCISPQQTFINADINTLHEPVDKKLQAIEPAYSQIPPGILRRMGKAVRMGVGAAMPLLQNNIQPDGIIMGTTNCGKDDSLKFLTQIIEYDEGVLTPINFVQSTPNGVAAQISLLTKNHGYNISHLHLGQAFELAITDAAMMLQENPLHNYLLGAVDDISLYNYNSEVKGGWYKEEVIPGNNFFTTNSAGSIAGEGAAMFLVNNNKNAAIAKLLAVDTLNTTNEFLVQERLQHFITANLPDGEKIDLFLTGENGDSRLLKYYNSCEAVMDSAVAVARYKHMCGEYSTSTAMAVWLCCQILQQQTVPQHMLKKDTGKTQYRNILIYNNYQIKQHSFILVSMPH
jgi:Beta-ketoacyl synthase, N-terminal domain